MKKFLIVVLCAFVLLPLIASAQVKKEGEAKEPATKLEAFLSKALEYMSGLSAKWQDIKT